MNISLTKELEKLVQQKVVTGRYSSASEVVREALRLLEAHDQLHQARLTDIKKKIAVGLASARAGRLVDGEESFARARARLGKAKKIQ
ncbi:MAG: type II toxin-antitoxin system ParD family antitoxin [Planctomycetes bacterium]|nr:type II toxin-antitoxin system ParD family antitoxin [Planctomycetota bacterium]